MTKFRALQDHHYDVAQAMLCPADEGSPDAFVQHWSNQTAIGHGITGHKIVGIKVRTFNGTSSAVAQIELVYADGYRQTEQLDLVKDGQSWRPCP